MFIKNWMTRKVFTVTPEDSISEAVKLIKDKGIKHIPVVKGSKLKGILSDRDIREYVPSKATSLDMYELHYLLQSTKVKTIMKKKVITTSSDVSVEEASMLLYDGNIGCLPVVDGKELVGIISDRDIFRALVDITGVRHGGNRITVNISDKSGSIKELADIIRNNGFRIQSIMSSYTGMDKGRRLVVMRTKGKGNFATMKKELQKVYKGVEIKKG